MPEKTLLDIAVEVSQKKIVVVIVCSDYIVVQTTVPLHNYTYFLKI